MRRLALIAAAAGCFAHAALPGLGTSFTVHVADAANRPVEGAFVVAREFVSVPQFHGSRTYCSRADVSQAVRGVREMALPAADLGHLSPGRGYALEAIAYAPGHCVERTPSASAAAYASMAPATGRERAATVQPGSDVWLRARRVEGDEDRLQYLLGLAGVLACEAWSERSRAAADALARAIQSEADAIARTRYERYLAQRVHAALASAATLEAKPDAMPRAVGVLPAQVPFARDFIVAPANVAVRFPRPGEPNQMVAVAVSRGASYAIAAQPATPGGATPQPPVVIRTPPPPAPAETRLVIHCRNGAPSACDLDERDSNGNTALASYAAELDADRFGLLLEAGADPSVATNLQGADAIDALIRRIYSRPPGKDSIEAAHAATIMELVAASPKASIRAELKAQLAGDPSQWDLVRSPDARALLVLAREKLAALPARAERARACEPVEPVSDYAAYPIRLRTR